MKRILFFTLLSFLSSIIKSQSGLTISILNASHSSSITCSTPVVSLTAFTNYTGTTVTYFWTGSTFTSTGASVNITAPGVYTLAVNAGSIIGTKTVAIGINTIVPVSTIAPPTTATISCGAPGYVYFVSVVNNPTTNVVQKITSPSGGILNVYAQSYTYTAMSPGVYTNVITNVVNGCSVTKNFTVIPASNFPSFSLVSPQNFTLGCTSKSVTSVSFSNPVSGSGGASSFTVFNGFSSGITTGPLSTISTYTFNFPGTYTAVMRDNTSSCESRAVFSIVQNTMAPTIDTLIVPTTILDCNTLQTTLTAISLMNNISYLWTYASTVNVASSSVVVNTNSSVPNASVISIYTINITDNNNLCVSTSTVKMYQNLFRPNANISPNSGGLNAITCNTPSIILYNSSTSTIPNNGIFQPGIAIGYLWSGPAPLAPLSVSSSYTANVPGTYTLLVKDNSNGCTAEKTLSVMDNRVYPMITQSANIYTIACPNGTVALNINVNSFCFNCTYSWTASPGINITSSNNGSLVVTSAANYSLTVTDPNNGCKSTAVFAVWACTGLSDNSILKAHISIKPNPSNGIFTIEKLNEKKNYEVVISNMMGQLIQKKVLFENETNILLNELPYGVYLIKVFENEVLLGTEKIIIE